MNKETISASELTFSQRTLLCLLAQGKACPASELDTLSELQALRLVMPTASGQWTPHVELRASEGQ